MKIVQRLLGLLAAACLLGAAVWLVLARQDGAPSSSGSSAAVARLPLDGGALTVPGVQSLDGGQQEGDQMAADRANPVAVAARERSRTIYAHLSPSQVGRLLDRSFPAVIDRPAGGISGLPAGARVVGYPSAHAVQVALPGRRSGIIESSSPVAERVSRDRFAAIDLTPTGSGTGYAPVRSDVTVEIPRDVSVGVETPQNGVSLTPVDPNGRPVSGQGTVDRSSVVYVNTQQATDTLVKPTPTGFQVDDVLRSASSPQQLFFKIGFPAGGTALQDAGSGIVRVQSKGATIATIRPPAASDAGGTPVPASMSVAGNTLAVSVGHDAGSYLYPIEVDPEVNDSQLATTSGGKRGNWEFKTNNESEFLHKEAYEGPGKEHLETGGSASYKASDFAYWAYETKGNSKIYELKTKTTARNENTKIESFLEFQSPSGGESKKMLSNEFEEPEYTEKSSTICAWNASKAEECLPGAGKEKNAIRFQQSATATPPVYNFSDTMNEGIVSISEPSGEHSTTRFNTASPEVEGEVEGKMQKRVNALYDAGIWLTKSKGALQFIAKDPGIGVATTRLEYEKSTGSWEKLSEHYYLEAETACQGVQCYGEHAEYWTVDPKLPDGEDKIRYRAEEAISGTVSPESEAESTKTVKVDTAAPHGIFLNGLPWGNELSEKSYKLVAEATDGIGSTVASSGVKSLALFVSGHEVTELGTQTGCKVAKGACSANAEWSINGAELGAGHHAIVIVATDNAGNESRLEETISIRHSTPVALGPGSVDLQSGDFTLGGTDVNMGSGLTVARNYSSRATEAGDEGPLGPQWSLNLGTTEQLVELPDHSMLITDTKGSQTIFADIGGGKFESPTGDSNLKLSLEENEAKEKLAYYLEDVAKHTKLKFTLPSGGTKVWVPVRQEGTVGTDTVTYAYQTVEQHMDYALPSGSEDLTIATGPDEALWFVDHKTNKVGRITTAGAITEYSLPAGSGPNGIAAGPDGNLWFTNETSGKLGKITTQGTISDEYTLPAGSKPCLIAAGPDGNLWFTNPNTNKNSEKIGKISPSGSISEYSLPTGSDACGIVTGPDGNLWFTDYLTGKVGKITTSGAVTEYGVPAGASSYPYAITAGTDGNLWFTDQKGIAKITMSGTVTEYSLSSGKARGITVGPDNNLWFTNDATGKVGKITTAGAITEYAQPGGGKPSEITTGPDGKLWFSVANTSKIVTMTTSGTVTEPTEALAPVPAGVSCSPMKAGCRALKFTYASATNATGEAQSEWGEYAGCLKKVLLDAYNPSSKAMEETAVAEYSYDQLGRLRVEWDPRVSPALKVAYGYDAEGHVTALTPPGGETWGFTYGAIAGDLGTGRLLKATQAPTSTELWKGEAVANTEAPEVSGMWYEESKVEGAQLAVSSGKWSGAPIAYGYQWEDCAWTGEACKPIPGATNRNYTPKAADVGYALVATVEATNGDGSVTAVSSVTPVVRSESSQFTEFTLATKTSPENIAKGPSGYLWYTGTHNGAGMIGNISRWGAITEYSVPAESYPNAIVQGYDGNLWYANRKGKIGKITMSGTIVEYALSAETYPEDITAGGDGNLWYTAIRGSSSMIGKITTSGTITEYGLPIGTWADKITAGPDGNLWYTGEDTSGGGEIGKITTSGAVTKYVLSEGSVLPEAITTGPDGNIWYGRGGEIGKITTSGTVTEYPVPGGDVLNLTSGSDGNIWYTVYNKICKMTPSGAVLEYPVPAGSHVYDAVASGPGKKLWYTNGLGKIGEFAIPYESGTSAPEPGLTVDYDVPLSGGSGLRNMTSSEVAKWGQTDTPVEGTAIFPPDEPQGWPASGYKRAAVHYLDARGREVNESRPSNATYGSVATTEYNEFNDVVRTLSPDNRQKALEAGSKSVEVAKTLDTESTYNGEGAHESEAEEPGTRLIETLGPRHTVKYVAGSEQKESLARLHTKFFYDEGAPSGTYNLLTKQTTLAQLTNEEEVEVRKATTSYSGQSNLGWTLRAPTSVTVDPEGKKLTTTTLYNSSTGQVTETRSPAGSGGGSAHDAKLIYYTAEANTEGYTACGSHPEWTGLVCETLPAKQPESGGLPKLPVSTVTYNMWNEPLVMTETFGSTVRTKTRTYDETGRLVTNETTSTADTTLPKVTNEYNSKTGVLEKQSTTVEGKTTTVTSKYNTLGRLIEYTDADGNIAKYVYGGPEKDGLLEEMTDGSNAGTGKQTYTYNSTTKQLEELTDSAAGVFKASYDAEGRLTSEVYPNAMCADSTYNATGEATKIEYLKTTTCSEHSAPVWFSETRSPSVRGETFSKTSTLSSNAYAYDTVGRLAETHETPSGEGCTTRLYAYDEESNRTSQTTRMPGGGGACATEGGTIVNHTYDEGNRLADTGIEYDAFGNVKKLPAADAEGHELVSTFYVDNAVATQSQSGVSDTYYLDPEGRIRETVSGATTIVTHYDTPGSTVAWTSETAEKSTRNIAGIDGTLTATQTNGGTPVLQLHDLQGNVVATAALSTSETKVLSTYDSTEFGVPNKEKAPPKLAWLGAGGIASALSSGVITYGSTSYVPQTGRALQSEAVDPPGAPHGTGVGAAYTSQEEPWVFQGAAAEAAEAPGLEAAREQAAAEAAVRAALGASVDPTVYYLQPRALRVGEALNKVDSWGEVWDTVFTLLGLDDPVGAAIGAVVGVITLGQMEDWLHNTGGKLEQCGKSRERWVEMCKLKFSTFSVLGSEFLNPYSTSEVEKCGTYLWYENILLKEEWECRRLNQPPSP